MNNKLTAKNVFHELCDILKARHVYRDQGDDVALIINHPGALSPEYISLKWNGEKYINPFAKYPKISKSELIDPVTFALDVGDNGEAWMHVFGKQWPCTLSDIIPRLNSETAQPIFFALMEIWSRYSHGWKCVFEDLKNGSAYIPVTVKTVFDSNSRYELICRWCGYAEDDAWTQPIGKSAFYERCKRLVIEEDLLLLKDYDPAQTTNHLKIGNSRGDLIKPLTDFIQNHIKSTMPDHEIADAIKVAISLNEKIHIPENKAKLKDWCVLQRIKSQKIGRLSQPKESFKKLKIPGWEKITSARMLKRVCQDNLITRVQIFEESANQGRALYTNGSEIAEISAGYRKFFVTFYGTYGNIVQNPAIKEIVESQIPFRDPRK